MSSPLICLQHIKNKCTNGANCEHVHFSLPYKWEMSTNGQWMELPHSQVEREFSNQDTASFLIQNFGMGDGSAVDLTINFEEMAAVIQTKTASSQPPTICAIHRLSTRSYLQGTTKSEALPSVLHSSMGEFVTQWRWYFHNGGGRYLELGQWPDKPHQSVIEAKFLAGQLVYRFELELETLGEKTYLLNLKEMYLACLQTGLKSFVRRRPRFVDENNVVNSIALVNPAYILPPFIETVPPHWFPVDGTADYELIPLSPEMPLYKIAIGPFLGDGIVREIKDVLYIQNPGLWYRYKCRTKYLRERGRPGDEKMLFHGTPDEDSIRAIFHQSLDPRLNGRNATVYGKGVYLADRPSISDRYTRLGRNQVRWMFLVRALPGLYAAGNKEYTRPPPIDPQKPWGELYDSCVDNPLKPDIYVIFDSDQFYPEYVISYVQQKDT